MDTRIGRAWVVTAVLLVGLATVAQWAPKVLAGTSTVLEAALIAAAIVLAVLAGVTGIMSWQLTGDARSFRMGLALLVLGGAALGLGGLVPLIEPHRLFGGPAVAAGALVALGFFTVALVRPEVDTMLRPRRAVAIALVLLAVLLTAFGSSGPAGSTTAITARLLCTAAFAALAVALVDAGPARVPRRADMVGADVVRFRPRDCHRADRGLGRRCPRRGAHDCDRRHRGEPDRQCR